MGLVIRTSGFEDYLSGGAYIKALIMGPPGAGKTRSASFWPDPIFADCENGRMSIADRGLPYGDVVTEDDMDELLKMLKLECAKGSKRRYQTFVVDTVDSYQRSLVQRRLEEQNKFALSGWEDWGYLDAKMTQFVEKLQNLPMHIVVNMHVKTVQDGDMSVTVPKLKGDIKDQIAGEFDLVGLMGTHWGAVDGERTLVRSIKWSPEPSSPILKDRSGRLPDTTVIDFTDQDFSRLYDAIVGDHIEDLPSTTVIEELVPAHLLVAAGPDESGGAVATVREFPRKKADKQEVLSKEPPAATDVEKVLDEKGDAIVEPTARTPEVVAEAEAEPIISADEAIEAVQNGLGGEVVSDEKTVDEPSTEQADAEPNTDWRKGKCGEQPPHMVGVKDPLPGCGKPLVDQTKVNVAVLKTGTWLCDDDYSDWKEKH